MGLQKGTVKLENDYLNWKKMFDEEKQNLKSIFCEIAIEIEHIGSTAVKGLFAKPIVDIAIAVNEFSDIEKIKDKLESLYTIKNNEENGEILLIKEAEEVTYFLIHVMKIDSKRYKDTIDFRNYIRENYDVMKQYEDLKVELAQIYADDRKTYTKSKNDFIQNVLNKINK